MISSSSRSLLEDEHSCQWESQMWCPCCAALWLVAEWFCCLPQRSIWWVSHSKHEAELIVSSFCTQTALKEAKVCICVAEHNLDSSQASEALVFPETIWTNKRGDLTHFDRSCSSCHHIHSVGNIEISSLAHRRITILNNAQIKFYAKCGTKRTITNHSFVSSHLHVTKILVLCDCSSRTAHYRSLPVRFEQSAIVKADVPCVHIH